MVGGRDLGRSVAGKKMRKEGLGGMGLLQDVGGADSRSSGGSAVNKQH